MVHERNDLRDRPETDIQLDRVLWKLFFQIMQCFDISTAEPVDGLLWVTNNEEPAVFSGIPGDLCHDLC